MNQIYSEVSREGCISPDELESSLVDNFSMLQNDIINHDLYDAIGLQVMGNSVFRIKTGNVVSEVFVGEYGI